MNVRIVLFLPLIILIALILPTMATAEKGLNQSRAKGKPEQKVIVQEKSSGTGENSKANINKNESANASGKAASEVKSQNAHNSATKNEKSKNLPDQANVKAKEAVQMKAEKQDKEKNVNQAQPKQKEAIKNPPKNKETPNSNSVPPTPPITMENTASLSDNKVDSARRIILIHEEPEITKINKVKKVEEPLKKLPLPVPEKKPAEVHMFQPPNSVKNPVGTSSDQKGFKKSLTDFIGGFPGEFVFSFEDPFVFRQHVYRNQWVNAPPAPPPRFALFFQYIYKNH